MRETSAGLAIEDEGFAITEVPFRFEKPEERLRWEGKEESKGRGEKMPRSTERVEGLSREEILGLRLSSRKTRSMWSFGSVGIEKIVTGWREKIAEESGSLKVTVLTLACGEHLSSTGCRRYSGMNNVSSELVWSVDQAFLFHVWKGPISKECQTHADEEVRVQLHASKGKGFCLLKESERPHG